MQASQLQVSQPSGLLLSSNADNMSSGCCMHPSPRFGEGVGANFQMTRAGRGLRAILDASSPHSRMQTNRSDSGSRPGMLRTLALSISSGGVTSIYQGLTASLLRQVRPRWRMHVRYRAF